MKLVCVLLLFAFLNVSALEQDNIHINRINYMKEMHITNYQLRLFEESKLDELIVHLLYSTLPIDKMVILLAAPDYCNEDYKTSIDIERIFRNVIKTKYDNIHEPSTTDLNIYKKELKHFGDDRRDLIYPSLKRILVKVEKGELLKLDGQKVCYLVALLKSSMVPRERVTVAKFDSEGCCTIVIVTGSTSYFKQYHDGVHVLHPISGSQGLKLGVELV
ncbi:uncharacterized protein LOC126847986 isoform X2 [Adelges cooleyi]|uniref:uncharacterized protein LOC126847986 isoform X2 n=1 Tax=Adelges cooleyi TaxID=133065 RepID=UPI00218039DD|nr:uncharacterized protein LOC126847986 isoform X2 [Adelges cooleyi]